MTEGAAGRELDTIFNVDLAQRLLALADAKNKIDAEEFSAQLWTWAMAIADLLENRLDKITSPALVEVRKELRRLTITLSRLSVEARGRLSEQLSGISEMADSRVAPKGNKAAALNVFQVNQFIAAANQAAVNCYDGKIKDGPKNRRQSVRRTAVIELGIAWYLLTGKRPTRRDRGFKVEGGGRNYGEFQDFVVAALEPLFGEEAQSGIDKLIKDAIKNMEETPQQKTSRFFHI